MALAETLLAAEFNRPGHAIVDHRTYVFVGDGCLMEGISHEACSLAGTLGLGKLIAFYDDNGISIDGDVQGWFTDDTPKRFEAYGWHVIADVDGHDVEAVDAAIARGACGRRPADAHLLQDGDRQGRAAPRPAPRRRTARRWARRRSRRRARRSAGPIRRSRFREAIYAAWDARDARRARSRARGRRRFAAYRAAHPDARRGIRAPHARASCRPTSRRRRRRVRRGAGRERRDRRHAQGLAAGASRPTRRCCRRCSAARPTSPARCSPTGRAARPSTRDAPGNYVNFGVREFAMSADRQRPRAARRLHSLRRHLPHVLRLRAQRAAHGGADEAAHRSSSSRTTRSASARTGRRTSRSSSGEPAPHPGHGRLAALRHGGDGGGLGGRDRAPRRPDVPAASRARTAVPDARRGADRGDRARRLRAAPTSTGGGGGARGRSSPPARRWRSRWARATRSPRRASRVRVVSMPCTSVFDAAGRRVSRARAAAGRAARRGRGRRHRRLAQVRRRRGRPRGAIVGIDTFGESAPAPVLFKHFGFTVERRRRGRDGASSRASSGAVRIRRAVPADAPAIAQVRVDAWRTTYRGMIPDALPRRA